MREIIFDTETTGIRHQDGHRIIEIGAIEMIDRIATGRTFHEFVNPDGQEVEDGAFAIHGISNEQLKDKPKFSELLPKFKEFFSQGTLIAHNASFDIGFFNMELGRLGEPPIDPERVVDTLQIARQKYPGAKNNLDALCNRFGISNAHRTLHGALLDSELLAEVYIELTGGKQVGFNLEENQNESVSEAPQFQSQYAAQPQRPRPLELVLSAEEKQAHEKMIEGMKAIPVWSKWTNL